MNGGMTEDLMEIESLDTTAARQLGQLQVGFFCVVRQQARRECARHVYTWRTVSRITEETGCRQQHCTRVRIETLQFLYPGRAKPNNAHRLLGCPLLGLERASRTRMAASTGRCPECRCGLTLYTLRKEVQGLKRLERHGNCCKLS